MSGYSVGPPSGENFGQPLYVPFEYGPGVEIVQWAPYTGAPAYIVSEWSPGAKSVMFENGMPPGVGQSIGPSQAEIAAATMAGRAAQQQVDMAPIHLLLLF